MYRIIGADQKIYGPVSREALLRWIAEGRANAQSLVQPEGSAAWMPLANLAEFTEALKGVAAPPALAPRRTNGMAIASLVMGIVAITLGLCCCYGFPFNVLGIIFACIAFCQIKRVPEMEEGMGVAIAGLALSLLSILLTILLVLVFAAASWPELLRELRKL